jgi:DNA-binding transcriptional LysR family regulator
VKPRRRVAGHVAAQGFRRGISRPVHYVPTAEGFGAAVRAGAGWGMFPEQLAASALADGSFVRTADAHLDVPLYWQCWKLNSPIVYGRHDCGAGVCLKSAPAPPCGEQPPALTAVFACVWLL